VSVIASPDKLEALLTYSMLVLSVVPVGPKRFLARIKLYIGLHRVSNSIFALTTPGQGLMEDVKPEFAVSSQ
jgi:hypothetical protein